MGLVFTGSKKHPSKVSKTTVHQLRARQRRSVAKRGPGQQEQDKAPLSGRSRQAVVLCLSCLLLSTGGGICLIAFALIILQYLKLLEYLSHKNDTESFFRKVNADTNAEVVPGEAGDCREALTREGNEREPRLLVPCCEGFGFTFCTFDENP